MRVVLIFLLITVNIFSQDTTYFGKDFEVKKNGVLIEKNFRSSKNWIKIVYHYNSDGILMRRYWYNKDGKILSVSLDN